MTENDNTETINKRKASYHEQIVDDEQSNYQLEKGCYYRNMDVENFYFELLPSLKGAGRSVYLFCCCHH
jgi:hypothetical protein